MSYFWFFIKTVRYIQLLLQLFIELLFQKKTGFFKEQNAGFSAKIYRVTLIKTWFLKKTLYAEKSTGF